MRPMKATEIRYHRGAERPALSFWIIDDDWSLIDFSGGGYAFAFRIGLPGMPAAVTKSTGITGAVGAGVEPTGTPNVVVTWAASELDISPGSYMWQLTSTTGGLDRMFEGSFIVLPVIT